MVRAVLSVIVVLTLSGAAAHGQDFFRTIIGPPRIFQPQPPAQRTAPAAVPARTVPDQKAKAPPETPPAYEQEMARLAEILGALHYLRKLCGSSDASRWRGEMQGLIETEQPPPERRDRLVASFNRSYVAYEQTYRTCTPAAGVAIRRYLDEGAKLSREIATRYGN
jgi:uncharacterized protein (TIGR02301 family)